MDGVGSLAPEVVLYFAASVDELYQLRMWLEPLAKLDRQVAIIVRSYEVFDALVGCVVPGDRHAVQRHDRIAAAAGPGRRSVRHALRQQPVAASTTRDPQRLHRSRRQ